MKEDKPVTAPTMRQRILGAMRDTIDATLPDGFEIDYHYAVEQVFNELAEPTEAMIEAARGAADPGAVFKAMIAVARR